MPIDLQEIVNSPLSIRLVSFIGRTMPTALGRRLADRIADQIARRRDSLLVRAMRLNQWVVRGEALEGEELDRVVRLTLRHSARSLFDLHHFIHDPQATERILSFDTRAWELVCRPEFEGRGVMFVGLHLSGFDLFLQWMCKHGMRPLVLTLPQPEGARRMEYEMRLQAGMNLVPSSVAAFRLALKHLQQGGCVITGADRPIPDPPQRPCFFGRPAPLPVHYAFLAMKAHVPVLVAAPHRQPDGTYRLLTSEFIEMNGHGGREDGLLENAEKVLRAAEPFIRQAPEQWSVPLPVWPELLAGEPS